MNEDFLLILIGITCEDAKLKNPEELLQLDWIQGKRAEQSRGE